MLGLGVFWQNEEFPCYNPPIGLPGDKHLLCARSHASEQTFTFPFLTKSQSPWLLEHKVDCPTCLLIVGFPISLLQMVLWSVTMGDCQFR